MTDILPFEELWPVQQQLALLIATALKNKSNACLCLGMRSGKTELARRTAISSGKPIVTISTSQYQAERALPDVSGVVGYSAGRVVGFLNRLKTKEQDDLKEIYGRFGNSFIIIDDAMWIDPEINLGSWIDVLVGLGSKVLVLSSQGANTSLNTRWDARYATWDVNPHLGFNDLKDAFVEEFDKSARDYGLFDSHDGLISSQFFALKAAQGLVLPA